MNKAQKEAEQYLEQYRGMVRKLQVLSQVATRQLMGSRSEGDPQAEYLTALEAFKNMANAQLDMLIRLAVELGVARERMLEVQSEELQKQVTAMEQDLCVTGWNADGHPVFDLQAYRERTAGWPG